ncbi:hypothetical protein ScalyP_jg2540 [Parmales sp. scaly parma]|nr:hypothetical protein ScalyP_jg2540 [Parmales sp. scaly parma]
MSISGWAIVLRRWSDNYVYIVSESGKGVILSVGERPEIKRGFLLFQKKFVTKDGRHLDNEQIRFFLLRGFQSTLLASSK